MFEYLLSPLLSYPLGGLPRVDCQQSLFFFRFSKGSARRETRDARRETRNAWNEGGSPRRKEISLFMPLPSRAISHARGHLRVSRFARRTYCRKKERLLVVYLRDDKTNNANLHNTDNNPNRQEANRGAERGTTKDKSNSISFLSSSAICLKQHSVTRN